MNKLIGPLGAFLMVIAAPMAHADLSLSYSINLGPTVSCNSPQPGNPNPNLQCGLITTPEFSITGLGASSDSPGTILVSQENSSAVVITNTDTKTDSIVINVASNGFTVPTIPPATSIIYFSNIGGQVTIGNMANLLSFRSCIDTTNSLSGCPGTNQTAFVTPSITSGPANYSAGNTGTITTSLPAPYAVDEQIEITLGAGSSMNFSAGTILTSTPEPMSVALLGGVLVFTGGMIRRKRKQTSTV